MAGELITSEHWWRTCNRFFYPEEEDFVIESGDVICVHSWFVPVFLKKKKCNGSYKIVTACGDAPVNAVLTQNELFDILDTDEHLTEWAMTQSWYDDHPKIRYLPIGFSGQSEYLIKNAERLRQKPKKNAVYYNFTISNKYERLLLPNSESKTYAEYLDELSDYKYAMCPPGVGIDIHKFYDAVAVGVIPIVKAPANFARMYEKYNFVSLPGQVHCTYIMGAPQLTEVLESVYIPEKQDVQNSIDMVVVTPELEQKFVLSRDEAVANARKVHEQYGEFFRNVEIKRPENSIIDHYRWLQTNHKCNHGYITFL